jgi:hypothetical protein
MKKINWMDLKASSAAHKAEIHYREVALQKGPPSKWSLAVCASVRDWLDARDCK